MIQRSSLPVLVVSLDGALREPLSEVLYRSGLEVHGALGADDALGVLGSHRRRWVVLLDVATHPVDGWAFLDAIDLFTISDDALRVIAMAASDGASHVRARRFVHGVLPMPLQLESALAAVWEVATVSR